jgi:hypothetical protein
VIATPYLALVGRACGHSTGEDGGVPGMPMRHPDLVRGPQTTEQELILCNVHRELISQALNGGVLKDPV